MSIFFLFLFGLSNCCLVLLSVGHSNHRQDQVNQIEWAEEDDDHKEEHIGFTCCPQCLITSRHRDIKVRDTQTCLVSPQALIIELWHVSYSPNEKGFPRSLESSAWKEPKMPNQRCHSWCNHNLDFCRSSDKHNPLDRPWTHHHHQYYYLWYDNMLIWIDYRHLCELTRHQCCIHTAEDQLVQADSSSFL